VAVLVVSQVVVVLLAVQVVVLPGVLALVRHHLRVKEMLVVFTLVEITRQVAVVVLVRLAVMRVVLVVLAAAV
jgi:hypothetical protein